MATAPEPLPRLGMGTWHMGEDPSRRGKEVAALQLGLDLGITLIDTAEMYGEGGAEEVVGEAMRGRRGQARIVTKFYPHHASRELLRVACARSLERLAVERIDCYLYHWRGSTPLAETVEALGELVEEGRIASWGVSNFDVSDLEELVAIPGGERVAVNQVLYNLARRGIEFDLLSWCRERGMDVMAYSPLDEGPLARHPRVGALARALGVTAAELALAWTLRLPGICSIPKASTSEHVHANRRAADLVLDRATLEALDEAFPPPRRKTALAMI
ncbi:MAG TPA: aldo/keto reductase [Usitatibacter sp.]|nr:aldo/keto reductase [Usitatibacter sp.]